MKKNIFKYSDFLFESIKYNIPDCGWNKISFHDYCEFIKNDVEEFTEEEIDFLENFAEKNEFQFYWNSEDSIKIECKETKIRIIIRKYKEDWFLVDLVFIGYPSFFIVDQSGIRDRESIGLVDILNRYALK